MSLLLFKVNPGKEQICHIQILKLPPRRSPLLPKVLPISSNSDRQPQAEAKNAFKNLKVGKLRT
ncbi:hypothetical protein F8R90_15105 [Nostoc sp. NZL]|nr:hypothetical protein [Nostoc sp. NZL]